MKQPEEPNKEDCCNSGCNPCIFDVYEQQMKLYKTYLECGKISNIHLENGISQLKYTTFVVVKNIKLCESHKLLVFKNITLDDSRNVYWRPGNHFLLKYTSTQFSCTRSYTPLILKLEHIKDYDFVIIVKKYASGVVSNYLFNINPGEQTLWRGPFGNYEVTPNKFDRIIMLAQGTGLVPFYSIIEHILNNEDDMTKIILLYCCQSVNTILMRDELYALKAYWNFTYEIYLSNGSIQPVCKYQEPIKHGKFSFEDLINLKPFSSSVQFLLCGSPQFMEQYNICLMKESIPSLNIILF